MPTSGSAAIPIKAWSGQSKAEFFDPINRKGVAVASKGTQGVDRCSAFLLVSGCLHKHRPCARQAPLLGIVWTLVSTDAVDAGPVYLPGSPTTSKVVRPT